MFQKKVGFEHRCFRWTGVSLSCQWPNLDVQFKELEGDFHYNLALLDQRDAELHEYDTSTAAMKACIGDNKCTINQLNSDLAEATSGTWILQRNSAKLENDYPWAITTFQITVQFHVCNWKCM